MKNQVRRLREFASAVSCFFVAFGDNYPVYWSVAKRVARVAAVRRNKI